MSSPAFDPELLAELYARHHEELFRYGARFTGDADLAEDLVQEAFVRLAERPPEQAGAIRAWLFRAVTTIAIDAHRSERRRATIVETSPEAVPLSGWGPDPAHAAELADLRQRVRAALALLDERDRTILLMREEGFAHHEIADAVGTTTKSVGTMIARALEKLSRHLPLDGPEHD